MLRILSSWAFFAELLLLAFPITVLAIFGGFLLFHAPPDYTHPDAIPTLAAFVVSYVGLLGFWGIALSFFFEGVEGVMDANPALWVAAAIGVLFAVSPIVVSTFLPPFVVADVKGFFVFAMFGIPLLVPLSHILLCVLVRAANNSFKPKPLRGSA